MVKLVISGIAGRMGKRIGILALEDKELQIVGGLEISDSLSIGKDVGDILGIGRKLGVNVEGDLRNIVGHTDVLIEFTTPQATMANLEIALNRKIGVVIGTTGLSIDDIEKIQKAAEYIPVVFSPNMSIGANLLFKLTKEAAVTLGLGYKVEIIEAHHSQKKDAPSGTAKRLGEVIAKVKGEAPPIKSIREGDIVGDHTVIFSGNLERIELTHRAFSRDTFAKGSLAAGKFLVDKKQGLYDMQDVINGTSKTPHF